MFTALAIARHLQNITGSSIKKIVKTLQPLQQVEVTIGGHTHLATDPLTEPAHQILETINASEKTH